MAGKELPSSPTLKTPKEIQALGVPLHVGTGYGCSSDPDNSGGDSREPELRIVLVGKTGAGKSATGNTLLGRREFESKASGGSVTKVCRKARTRWNGRDIAVVDTPGIFDTETEEKNNLKEIARFMTVSSPGPHALLLVLRVGRFTQEEKAAIEQLYRILGAEAVKFLIILFTRKEDLGEESLGEYVRTIDDSYFKELLEKCENRCCAFNNYASGVERDAQVSELMAMIEKMVQNNGGTHYTNNTYKSVERFLQEDILARQQRNKEQFDREREELRRKYGKMFEKFEKEKETWKEEKEKYKKEKEEYEKKLKAAEEQYEKKQENSRMEAENDENVLVKIITFIVKVILSWFTTS
ncbi:GTPase IMAP family member 4-like [Trichosurus vulpecula]|uniref:GTPase IMAP family member 4-like n=1 Tax=Trichosurus vulpecula TaxID=9337 RepID=UPI00186AC733|nr:GTPase IMAP family member 4-like [Trichosurus vulpecula]